MGSGSTPEDGRRNDWQVAHGALLVILIACAFAITPLRRWPWIWLAPLVAYFMVVLAAGPLRRSMKWLRFGRLSTASLAATLGVIVLTSATLCGFHAFAKPDVSHFRANLPLDALGGVFLAGVLFSLINATLEEFVFRGVFFDALKSQYGIPITVAVTASLFGLGHLRGYPPGFIGAGLAVVFGCLMGVMRVWTGGLAAPIAAHIAADATIYTLVLGSHSN